MTHEHYTTNTTYHKECSYVIWSFICHMWGCRRAMNEKGLYTDIPVGIYLELEAEAEERDMPKKDVVAEALEAYLGVSADESEAVIRRKMERERRQNRDLKEELESLRSRLNQSNQKLATYEDMLEEAQSESDAYATALDETLTNIENGNTPHIWEQSRTVTDIATEHDRSPSEVIYDLRERAIEQERDVKNTNFMQAAEAEQTRRKNNEKPITEVDQC